ncbi:hypothetical protein [Haloglycomyces albus]|uniref:hypothetical protein n=1 Tax=Haloglycomyces albus TaxID=526067 RepID=UPI0004AC9CE3|nr:hypothetical protein [Haloglycomyces albus]
MVSLLEEAIDEVFTDVPQPQWHIDQQAGVTGFFRGLDALTNFVVWCKTTATTSEFHFLSPDEVLLHAPTVVRGRHVHVYCRVPYRQAQQYFLFSYGLDHD